MNECDRWQSFNIIEVSSIILSSALECGKEEFIKYLHKITEKGDIIVSIVDEKKVIESIGTIYYMFEETKN